MCFVLSPQTTHADFHSLDASMPLLGSNFGNHTSTGGGTNSTLPPSSLVLPVQSSSISIMTVAPTILSVKSPSLGQTRNQQTNRSISTASVAGSTSSSRVNPSTSSLVSYLDIVGNDYNNVTARSDGTQSNLVYSTSSISSSSSSILSSASGGIISASDLMGLQQHQTAGAGNSANSNSSNVNNLQNTDLSVLHHQQQGISPMMNLHQDGTCSTSALQTLASVATSSHMGGLSGVSMANSQQMGPSGSMMGLSMGINGSLSSVSVGHLHQQQQAPIMTLSHPDSGSAMSQV